MDQEEKDLNTYALSVKMEMSKNNRSNAEQCI